MSEKNTVRSNGTLQLVGGKKYRGTLVADEKGAAFYPRGKTEPVAEWHYARMNRMDSIRRGGTTTQITVILKDDTRYVMELDQGLKCTASWTSTGKTSLWFPGPGAMNSDAWRNFVVKRSRRPKST